MTAAAKNIIRTFTSDLEISTVYKVKIVTDNGFVSEGSYSTSAAFA